MLTPCIAPHRRPLVARYAGYASAHSGLVVPILLAKEGYQGVLLHVDALREEGEAHIGVEEEADRVEQHDLSAHRPEEPAHIGGMAAQRVDTRGHEAVVISLTIQFKVPRNTRNAPLLTF